MKKRGTHITLTILLLLFCSLHAGAQQDTAQTTHSLDDFKATDTAVVTADSAYADDSSEEETEDTLASFEKRFSSLPANNTIQSKKLPAGEAGKLKADDDFWYADAAHNKKEDEANEDSSSFWAKLFNFFANKNVHTALWILMIVALLAALVFYLHNNGMLFGRSARKLSSANSPQEEEENIYTTDFENAIKIALTEGDYRLAVRLYFLRMLKHMADKQLLRYEADKTNMDYLFELSGSAYYKDFAQASRNYEYVWYGKFPLTKEQFSTMETTFKKFDQL